MAKKSKLARLRIYPVKGFAGMDVDSWELDEYGLRLDRRWMVVDASGRCMTPRNFPELGTIRAEIEGETIVLSAPHQSSASMPVEPEPGPTEPASIAGDVVAVQEASEDASRWLRELLRAAVRIVFLPDSRHRTVDPAFGARASRLAFQDELPLRVVTSASIDDLNDRLAGDELSDDDIRANLFIRTASGAYEEDTWRRVRVGEIELDLIKPWPHSAIVRPAGQAGADPVEELATYRSLDGQPRLGQLGIAATTLGLLRVGDRVEVLERGDPPVFDGPDVAAEQGDGADAAEEAEADQDWVAADEEDEAEGEEPVAEEESGRRRPTPRRPPPQGPRVRLSKLPRSRSAGPSSETEAEAGPEEPAAAKPPASGEEVPEETAAAGAEPEVGEAGDAAAEDSPAPASESKRSRPVDSSPSEKDVLERILSEPDGDAQDEGEVTADREAAPVEPPKEEAPAPEPAEAPVEVAAGRVPELDQVARLLAAAAVAETTSESRALAEACLRAPVLVTAWRGDSLIGLLRGWTDEIRDGFIADVAVHPDQHSSGAAQDLVRKVVELHPQIRWVLRASPGSAYLGSALGWQHAGSGWYISPR